MLSEFREGVTHRAAKSQEDRDHMKQKDEDGSWQPFSDWYKRGCHVTAATVNEAASSKASETTENSDMKDVEGPSDLPVNPDVWSADAATLGEKLRLSESTHLGSDVFTTPRKATNTHKFDLVDANLARTKEPVAVRKQWDEFGATAFKSSSFGEGAPYAGITPQIGTGLVGGDSMLSDNERRLCELCHLIQVDLYKMAHSESLEGGVSETQIQYTLKPLFQIIASVVNDTVEVIDGRCGYGPLLYVFVKGKWYRGYADLIVLKHFEEKFTLVIGAVEVKQVVRAGAPMGQCASQMLHFNGRQTLGYPTDVSIIAKKSPAICLGELTNGLVSVLMTHVGQGLNEQQLFRIELSGECKGMHTFLVHLKRTLEACSNVERDRSPHAESTYAEPQWSTVGLRSPPKHRGAGGDDGNHSVDCGAGLAQTTAPKRSGKSRKKDKKKKNVATGCSDALPIPHDYQGDSGADGDSNRTHRHNASSRRGGRASRGRGAGSGGHSSSTTSGQRTGKQGLSDVTNLKRRCESSEWTSSVKPNVMILHAEALPTYEYVPVPPPRDIAAWFDDI